jgi:putative membrane protein
MIRLLPLFAKGFAMGSADVVPGVSGGTMALVTGIYGQLLEAIRSVDGTAVRLLLSLQWRAALSRIHVRFLAVLLAGIFTAVLFFTRVVPLPTLIHTHPVPIYGLFFGLVMGSVWTVGRGVGRLDGVALLFTLAGAAIGLRVVTLIPADTPDHPLFIFAAGAIAICAMVLPGISGSFILLILRKYDYVLGQMALLGGPETLAALGVLIPFGLGILTGLAAFTRFLSWLLHRYGKPTMAVLIGFMIGSLWVIWPWQERVYETVRGKDKLVHTEPLLPGTGPELLQGVGMMALGLVLVLLLERMAERSAARG